MDITLAQKNFARWEAALLTRTPETVADLYAGHGTLIPTMAKQVITDREGVIGYFTFFGSFNPTVVMLEEHMEPTSDNGYLHCGVYRFTLEMNGKKTDVDARFTMVWEQADGDWQILHHHSSRIPEVA